MCSKTSYVFLVLFFLLSTSVFSETYTFGAGSKSGTYYPLGMVLSKVWIDNIDHFDMRVEETAASVENTIKVSNDTYLAGIAMSNVVEQAHQGVTPFPKKMDVSVLFALYPNVVQFIVPAFSSIMSIQDLKGKRVSLGEPGSGTRVSAIDILNAVGINENDVIATSLSFSETAEAITSGQIDAGVIVGNVGVKAIKDLAYNHHIRILSFTQDELTKVSDDNACYQPIKIPANSYKNVPAFIVPAVWNILIVNKALDTELAYKMTKVAFENLIQVNQVIRLSKFTTVENINKLHGIELHPGSLQYLKEHQ